MKTTSHLKIICVNLCERVINNNKFVSKSKTIRLIAAHLINESKFNRILHQIHLSNWLLYSNYCKCKQILVHQQFVRNLFSLLAKSQRFLFELTIAAKVDEKRRLWREEEEEKKKLKRNIENFYDFARNLLGIDDGIDNRSDITTNNNNVSSDSNKKCKGIVGAINTTLRRAGRSCLCFIIANNGV